MAHPGFIVEFNNPTAYGKQFRKQLKALHISAKRLPHKTAWLLNYDGQFKKFKTLQARIRRAININGSALIASMKTGQAWVLTPQSQSFKLRQVV